MFKKNESVEEYVAETIKPEVAKEEAIEARAAKPVKTRQERRVTERRHKKMIEKKKMEFSFEVKEKREKIPEIEEVKETIDKGEDAISLYLKAGRYQEAKKLKQSLSEARCEIEMLDMVMNLDFTRPKGKAKQKADEMGLDLTDPQIIKEFKKIQQERIEELKAKRDTNYKPKPKDVKNPLAIEVSDFKDEDMTYDAEIAEQNMQKIIDAAAFLKKVEEEPKEDSFFRSINVTMFVAFSLWILSLLYLFTI